MSFNPQEKLMNMRGKDYLEVKYRIVWFREDYPKGSIQTDIVMDAPVVIRASVFDEDGNLLAHGMGTPKQQGVAKTRPFEGAETAAIGRALAHAGYGTQFTGEDEGEHLADSPVERITDNSKNETVPLQLTPELIGKLIEAGLTQNEYSAKTTAEKIEMPTAYATNAGWIKWAFTEYRNARTDGLTSDDAAESVIDAFNKQIKKGR